MSRFFRLFACWLATFAGMGTMCRSGAAERPPERFTARFENGTLLHEKQITEWFAVPSQPKLGSQLLLKPDAHVRWLRDNSLPLPSPPAAYVEFAGGDRLPGKVTAFLAGDEDPLERQPPHLVVEHPRAFDWPTQQRETLRVTTAGVRRIVWQRRTTDLDQPGVAFLRDGRQLRFRSLRFQAQGARLLLEEGTQDIPFSQMAELHLPRSDPWAAYFEQLARLTPDLSARLLRLETSDGLIATGTSERFVARPHESTNSDHWWHAVQPAWCLDPIWARHRTIQLRRWSLPQHVPLSEMQPTRVGEPTAGGGHWPWRKDRNVRGESLRASGEDIGWGIGDHAPSILTVTLPAEARMLQTRIALDQIAGGGGCARAAIHLGDAKSAPLFRSDLLIGSKSIIAPPPIALPPATTTRQLFLVADSAHAERPPGADPLNIRDFVDWLEPEVELDRAELLKQVRRRVAGSIAAWDGWTMSTSDQKADNKQANLEDPVELVSRWDESDPAEPTFRWEALPRVAGWSLSRTLKLTANDQWLCLAVCRLEKSPAAKIMVRINRQPAGEFDVPLCDRANPRPDPLIVPLRQVAGQTVTIELTPQSTGEPSKLLWRGIAVMQHHPNLRRLFDEEPNFAQRLNHGAGKAEVIKTDRHLGVVCLKVTPPERGAVKLLSVPIRERPKLGEFRYLRFAWKKVGGQAIGVQIGHAKPADGQARFGPHDPEATDPGKSFRYVIGEVEGPGIRVAGQLPREWTVVTRDLYADFDRFDFTGLSLEAIDGEHALFDHIYLARDLKDLDQIDVVPAGK